MVLAIFDVDHTLIPMDSLKSFGLFLWRKNGMALGKLSRFAPALLSWTLGWRNDEELKVSYLRMFLQGMAVTEAGALAREFAQSTLLPSVTREGAARIHWHRQERHQVVMLSASPDIYLSFLAEALAADALICTRADQRDGCFTGEIVGANCKGEQKVRELLARYRQEDVDWLSSYAYADSLSDVPILERVGHPVAVNAGGRLKRLAAQRRWRVEQWQD
ncbi:MAG: HAD family hydrolase [Candidatus Binatia bacterium]